MTGLINVRILTGQFWPTPLLSGFALILLIKIVRGAARLRIIDILLIAPSHRTTSD